MNYLIERDDIMTEPNTFKLEAGFSLIELMIAMSITVTLLGLTTGFLASSFNVRARENQKTDALADSQRALNVMTREIANAGFGLANNGIVAADSTETTIRVRANLNAFDGQTTSNSINDRNEDVKYSLYTTGAESYIVRLDIGTQNQTTVLANRVDALRIRYYPAKVSYTLGSNCDISTTSSEVTQKSDTKYIIISVCVELTARGRPGSPGYQPASRVQLVSDVYLRNADIVNY
ncbi:MAG TPA: prepilin-type N-terminal cleavage/methylation domain-containing protein [Pyrinomonadaceae bacterium]|nr:prepilin-type N-terminal cleavage/methylation domain-containing protein [Pyrinomonadaceae bacterium]